MDFKDLARIRRSIRKYTDEKLTPEQVELILSAALMSPASKRANPWEFVVVEDKEVLEQLASCKKYGAKLIADATLAIVVIADPLKSTVWIEDASIASIMIQLQAEDLGLGSCWVQIRDRYTVNEEQSESFVRGILDIPLQMQVLSIIAIGHKAEEKKPFEKDNLEWEKVHISKYKS